MNCFINNYIYDETLIITPFLNYSVKIQLVRAVFYNEGEQIKRIESLQKIKKEYEESLFPGTTNYKGH